MKYILVLIMLTGLFSFNNPDDIYGIPLKNIDGATIDLNIYRGRKIMLVILPLSTQDNSISTTELISIENQFDSLIVIGVPAEEMGFTSADKGKIKSLYRNQGTNFILTEGMEVKKSAGPAQATIFQWLTNKSRNHHFNNDVSGTGDKFFVDEKGKLYGEINSQFRLSDPTINRILSKPRDN
jgi:glutathione peroxidase